MNYISALAVVLGIASGVISIYEFIKKGSWRPGVAYSVAAVILIGAAVVVANLPPPSGGQVPGTSSIKNSSTSTSGTGDTSSSTQVSATQPPAQNPSPTTAPTLPCMVNLSTWTNGSADWKPLNGTLLNDGTNDTASSSSPSIVAPCQLGNTNNYAVETKIQVTTVGRDACFGIAVRGITTSDGWQGYKGGAGNCGCCNSLQGVYIEGPDFNYAFNDSPISFDPGTNVHTYRMEARNNTISFFIDGVLMRTLTDNKYLTGTDVGLFCQDVQLTVTSFEVVAL